MKEIEMSSSSTGQQNHPLGDKSVSQNVDFILDKRRAVIKIILAGIEKNSFVRAAIYNHKSRGFIAYPPLDSSDIQEIDVSPFIELYQHSVKVQAFTEGRWRNLGEGRRLSESEIDEIYCLDPASWGINVDCHAIVRTLEGKTIVERLIPAGQKTHVILGFANDDKYQLVFYAVDVNRSKRGEQLSSTLKILPSSLRGGNPELVENISEELQFSRRKNVTLSPTWLAAAPTGGGLSSTGYSGAWSDGQAIAECVEFTMGRQQFLFSDQPSEVKKALPSPIIYLGLPHGGWGHFLTEGLSRIWYAMRHPELPVLWDSSSLKPFTKPVLELLDIRNEMHFLTEHSYAEEVIFPFPGIGLGDYVSRDFAREIGVVPPTPVIPGKKLFLTRSQLKESGAQLVRDGERRLSEILEKNGFEPFAPELHSLSEQLDALSSAEVVVGVEGSAFHSLLLLGGPLETRYWALTRHRGGGGVYEHIKQAKGLKYETLNYLRGHRGGFREALDLDLDQLEQDLNLTKGLTQNLDILSERMERPINSQLSYEGHLTNTQIRLSRRERIVRDVNKALREKDTVRASSALGTYF